jgi:2-desacetyl-2-hydroxyethyl bacteriochlorophyllide A dehydrogenase
MSTMKVARLFGPNDLRVVDMPLPEPGPHEVLCKVSRVGVCGTDHAIYTGEFTFVRSGDVHFPMTLGHEWSGTVAALGRDASQFRLGDRVTGDTAVACGYCTECLLGRYDRCKGARAVGTINAWDGAYAEYILMPERHVLHLPDSVSFDNGAMVEPAATAMYAVHKARVQPGDVVLIQGSGPIGIMASRLAKLCGAARVLLSGRKDAKLKAALAFGADAVINTTRESVTDAVRRLVPEGKVDRVIEASGSRALFSESLGLIRVGGVMSVLAFYESPLEQLDLDRFVCSDASIVAVAGSLGMYPPVLKLMAAGMFDCTPLITSRAPLLEAPDVLARYDERAEGRTKIMLHGA